MKVNALGRCMLECGLASPVSTDGADLHLKLREQNERLHIRGLEERLRDQRHWIKRQAGIDQAERSPFTAHQS